MRASATNPVERLADRMVAVEASAMPWDTRPPSSTTGSWAPLICCSGCAGEDASRRRYEQLSCDGIAGAYPRSGFVFSGFRRDSPLGKLFRPTR